MYPPDFQLSGIGRGIALIVQTVELERLHQARDVLFCGNHPRLVGAANDFRHHQGGENAENDDDYHHFEQGESTLPAKPDQHRPIIPVNS